MTSPLLCSAALICLAASALAPAVAQTPGGDSLLTIDRIYASSEFRSESFGPASWLGDGSAYTTVESAPDGSGSQLIRYDAARGTREVLVSPRQLTPNGVTTPLEIDSYSWSPDGQMLLLFTNSKPVWRMNTRGDYWVLDRTAGTLRKLGGPDAKPSTLMFAKFSPDGRRVGFVRENNIYVEELATGTITPLTTDGSRTLINGTFDWVYEEELMNYHADGWRWSPDGQSVAYWQLNADSVRDFQLINNTDSLYPVVTPIQYPKVGETNSAARVGVVSAAGGATRWLALAGDPRNHYIGRMEWAANSGELILQRLNRLQNTNEVMLGDVATGAVRTILVERDSAWLDLVDDWGWLSGGKQFTWVSDRDGWNRVYLVSRDGRTVKPVTGREFDVVRVQGVDEKGGWLYYIASPDNSAQRYLYRTRLNGTGKAQRLSPASEPGNHAYDISPSYRYAFQTYSSFGNPRSVRLVALPSHRVLRPLVENQALRMKIAGLKRGTIEFFTLAAADGTKLPAYLMKPADFDSTKRYPLLFYVYGGPATSTVQDAWDRYYLFHLMLTQRGYLVASVDNRGTPAPLGRRWRKAIYGQMGVREVDDQAAAARELAKRPYVDPARIGIWGWSNGGFMSLNMLFRRPGLYSAGVAVAPVTHWALYDNVYTERYNGLLSTNRDGYDRGSPLTYVDSLQGNLLVVHGSGDDNVHYQNTEVLINALITANKPFEMLEYPNRTHCVCQGRNTQRHLFGSIARFLDKNLAQFPPVSPPAPAPGS